MKIIEPNVEILYITPNALDIIEKAGRQCWKSDINQDNQIDFIQMLIKLEHLTPIEFADIICKITCSRACSHQLVRHRLLSICLSGDTIVKAFVNNSKYPGKQWTIEQLFKWQTDKKRKGRLKLISLRSVEKNLKIVPNKISKIIYSGKQEIFLTKTLTGRSIKTTLNHRFYTPNGYVELKDLKIGDKIYGNGKLALDNYEYLHKRYIEDNITRKELALEIGCCEATLYKSLKKFNIVKPVSQYPNRKPGYGKKGMFTKETLVKMSDSKLGEKNHSWKGDNVSINSVRNRAKILNLPKVCYLCGSTNGIEIHHYDKNPFNNDKSNLYPLCCKCHNIFHHQNAQTVFSDEIISIESAGYEDTYDIEMENEPHNFVANGLVVHNCQESQRYCNYSKDKFGHNIKFIKPIIDYDKKNNQPIYLQNSPYKLWEHSCINSELAYFDLINHGCKAEIARYVLNESVATELQFKCNFRELLHILKLRTSSKAQAEIRYLMMSMKLQFESREYSCITSNL